MFLYCLETSSAGRGSKTEIMGSASPGHQPLPLPAGSKKGLGAAQR